MFGLDRLTTVILLCIALSVVVAGLLSALSPHGQKCRALGGAYSLIGDNCIKTTTVYIQL